MFLCTVFCFPILGIRMKGVMTPSAQRDHEQVMRFCRHYTKSVAGDVVRIIRPVTTGTAWLALYPLGVFRVLVPAALAVLSHKGWCRILSSGYQVHGISRSEPRK